MSSWQYPPFILVMRNHQSYFLFVVCYVIMIMIMNAITQTAGQDSPPQVPINSTSLLDIILQQQADEVVFQNTEAQYLWQNATLAMSQLNQAYSIIVQNLTSLMDPPAGAAFLQQLSAMNGNDTCAYDMQVGHWSDYVGNGTAMQAFFCCHLARVRVPALLSVLTQAYVIFHLVPMDFDSDNTPAALQGLSTAQYLDIVGAMVQPCIDDNTVFIPQQAQVRAVAALSVYADILQIYGSMNSAIKALSGCIGAASGSCSGQTTPINSSQLVLNFHYWMIDPAFQEVCGYEVLQTFNVDQYSLPCSPISPQ